MTKKYDLHIHSTASDGTFSPRELIDLALLNELSGISITDHDTIHAYTEDFFSYAQEKGIELITGVEFSSAYGDTGVHILGYCFDVSQSDLREFCLKHKERRRQRNLGILELLNKSGMDICEKDLQDVKGVVGRPHIAQVLVQKGYVATIQEAFLRFIGDGKPCFTPGTRFSIEETIKVIHKAGGKAILAHPILFKKRSLIKKLLEFPFDGMECFYANFSQKQHEEMCHMAEKQGNLLQTGGSDFHGSVKPYSFMGSSYTSEENLKRLKVCKI